MVYLDNGATSRFKPDGVFEAMKRELTYSVNPGRSGHTDAINCAIRLYETRKAVKDFLGADDTYEVIFTANCTEALNLAIFGYLYRFEKKADVVTTVLEHNAVLRPLYKLASMGRINVILVKPDASGHISPADIKNSVTPNTKLIAVTHVSNVTGAEADVAEIARIGAQFNIKTLVDGAQSLGHLPVNLLDTKIDMIAGAGHKGLHGPQGVGFLAFKSNLKLLPIRFGGTGTHSDSVIQPDISPEAYESGTLNMPGIAGFAEGLKWTSKQFDAINQNNRYLAGELIYGLKQIPKVDLYTPDSDSSVVTFNISDFSSAEVGNILDENNIAVRSGLHCAPLAHRHLGTISRGAVRASIGYCNNISDIKAILELVEKIAAH